MPGIFSRENDRYGATICADDTCHADPRRVTAIDKKEEKKLYINCHSIIVRVKLLLLYLICFRWRHYITYNYIIETG